MKSQICQPFPMDLNSTAAASSESGHSPNATFAVRLLVFGIDYHTTVTMSIPYNVTVMVVPQNTVGHLLCYLSEYVPGCTRDLHVVLGGQQLPREATIGELCLPHDATLHVTPHPEAYSLICQIAATTIRSLPIPRNYHELFRKCHSRGALRLVTHDCNVQAAWYRITASREIVPLIDKFLRSASTVHERQEPYRAEMIAEYLGIAAQSGLVAFLVRHYLSNSRLCHDSANQALRRLLSPCSLFASNGIGFHVVEVWMVPLCVEICWLLASSPGEGKNDPLYKFSQRRLAEVFHLTREELPPPHSPALPRDWLIEKLASFVQDTADEVIGFIVEGRALPSLKMYEFKIFFSVLCWASSPGGLSGEPQQIATVDETAMSLLRAVDDFMERLGRGLLLSWPRGKITLPDWATEDLVQSVWEVLTKLDSWSEMHGQAAHAMRATLAAHRVSLNVLVQGTSDARCQHPDFRWVVDKHKDLLGFQARRHHARAMLREPPSINGRLQSATALLLPSSLEYVADATRSELHTGDREAKQWLTRVCQKLFEPQQALFSPCPRDNRRFFLNPASAVNPRHLRYLNYAGRIIGVALKCNVQLGICLDRTLFLQLAGRPVTLDDIADADPTTLANCRKILEMDPDLVDLLGLTFAREVEVLGSREIIELLPGGRNMAVDGMNRRMYIELLVQSIFVKSTKDQMASFAEGFETMVVRSVWRGTFFQSLDLEDFDRMLCGRNGAALDVGDWRSRTSLLGYSQEDDQIKWFWMVVQGMTDEQRRRLLFFWTLLECLPLGGFGGMNLGLIISRATHQTSDHLPSSSTSLNLLSLPYYTSFAMTQSRLGMVIQDHMCSAFGAV